MNAHALAFAVTFAVLYAAHQVGDHWVQQGKEAAGKGAPGWRGRIMCARHVATLTATKAIMLVITFAVTGLPVAGPALAAGLTVDAASHYWADRRTTLARLAQALGKSDFYALGTPRPGRDDLPTLGTGAYALDQSWHIAWLWIVSLIIAI